MKGNLVCDHCGDDVVGRVKHTKNDKIFCCNGCKVVYELLTENNLGNFYVLEEKSGVKPKEAPQYQYDFLEVPEIRAKLVDFEDDTFIKTTLYLPEIHCSSCIYLLENLSRILPAVTSCHVEFIKKEALITFRKNELSFSELAQFLNKIGYAPNFGNRKEQGKKLDKQLFYKLGLAGFAFGSIMLWSVPEYVGVENNDEKFRTFTSWLSFILSVPVLLYSARGYFISAFKAIRSKSLNLDVPITLGIIALYLQSSYMIFVHGSSGYMDSFAGFIFFLLIGKWFQNRTYRSLSFERDYTSYFPVAVTRISNQAEEIVEIEKIEVGETILIRNEEVVPCDSILLSERAKIDYSFVTGESEPIYKQKGDFIYAGGRLLGQKVKLKAEKEANRSLLTQLWNDVVSEKDKTSESRFKLQDVVAKYFLAIVLIIALIAGTTWFFVDSSRVAEIVVAVLIVACPCALALSMPFTYGNTMKKMGRFGLYLKNSAVVEQMNSITDVVFDKTGTLTESIHLEVTQIGEQLTKAEEKIIYSLVNSSTHPLSRAVVQFYKNRGVTDDLDISNFDEIPGKGLKGTINGIDIKLGSHLFIFKEKVSSNETESFYQVGNKTGKFVFNSQLREGIKEMLDELGSYQLHILSGDKDKDKDLMLSLVGNENQIHFNQSPKDKLKYVETLQSQEKKVLMVGDGLNDSGALGKANVGIAVSEDVFRFAPSADAIIEANQLKKLNFFLDFSHYAKKVLLISFVFSLTYNTIGLSFAVMGYLTPLVAAILMPLSSVSVVGLSTLLIGLRKADTNSL